MERWISCEKGVEKSRNGKRKEEEGMGVPKVEANAV